MPTFLTSNRHGYNVRFSRTTPNVLAVATSQLYGLAGGGTLYFLELIPDKNLLVESQQVEWSDGLFDVAWAGRTEGVAACGAGDGAIVICKVGCAAPVRVLKAHKHEVSSVQWPRDHLLSASWDMSIKLWDPEAEKCLNTYSGHSQLVYAATFNPHTPSMFASVSGDGFLKIWSSTGPPKPIIFDKVYHSEILSCDWSNTDPNVIALAGSDGDVVGNDIRRLGQNTFSLKGCEYAVRRIQFSPHLPSVLAAVSYDSTTRIWDLNNSLEPMETITHHSEFTYGLDWDTLSRNQIADCGWDSLVHVFTPRCLT